MAILPTLGHIKWSQMPGLPFWAAYHVVLGSSAITKTSSQLSQRIGLVFGACVCPQAHGQAGTRLLTLREDRASGEIILTGVDRRHPLYRGHAPYGEADMAGAAPPPQDGSAENGASAGSLLQCPSVGFTSTTLYRQYVSTKTAGGGAKF